MKHRLIALLAILVPAITMQAVAADYAVDAAHTQMGFKVKHLSISTVSGRFDKFSGSLSFDEGKLADLKGGAEIDAASVNTNSEGRDKHLRSADFFDVEKFPALKYEITGVRDVDGAKGKLVGNLTMHGVTKEVLLDAEVSGPVKGPKGDMRIGLSASGQVNRRDFGIEYAAAAMIGDMVTLDIAIEAVEQAQAQK